MTRSDDEPELVEGQEPGRCNAKNHIGPPDQPRPPYCRHRAGYRTNHVGIGHCWMHGGRTAKHVESAQKKMLEKAMATYGTPVAITPEEAMLRELERTAGAIEWLGELIAQLDPKAITWGKAQAKQLGHRRLAGDPDQEAEVHEMMGHDLYEITLQAGTNALVRLYLEERKHLTDVAAKAIKAGLDERRVELAERQGGQIRSVLSQVFTRLQLTDTQMSSVPGILADVLAGFAGGRVINGQVVMPGQSIEA